jgi:hypothetical protein
MGMLPDLAQAKSINTNGLMNGIWNRLSSKKTSNIEFQSASHPDYTLTFKRAYSVIVSTGENKKSYCYFWDPERLRLTEIAKVEVTEQDDKILSIDVLSAEDLPNKPKEKLDKMRKIVEDRRLKESPISLDKENESLSTKIKDLTMQVQSLQFICAKQEKELVVASKWGRYGKGREPKSGRKMAEHKVDQGYEHPSQVPTVPSYETQMRHTPPCPVYKEQYRSGVSNAPTYNPDNMYGPYADPMARAPYGASNYPQNYGYGYYDPHRSYHPS